MNTSLSATGSMFAGTVGTTPAPSSPTAPQNTTSFSLSLVDDPRRANTAADVSADNNRTDSIQSDVANRPSQNFTNTLGEKMARQRPNGDEDKQKLNTEDSTRRALATEDSALSVQAQQSTNSAVVGNPPPRTTGIDSLQADQQQKRAKTLRGPVQLINGPRTSTLKPVLPGTRSNEQALSAKDLISENSSQKQTIGRFDGWTVRQARASPFHRFTVSSGQETPILNYRLPLVQGKSPGTEQKAPISPKKSALTAEKPTGSAPSAELMENTVRQSHGRTVRRFDGSTVGRFTVSNCSVRKVNITDVQMCPDQAKDRGSSTRLSILDSRFPSSIQHRASGIEHPASSIEFEQPRLSALDSRFSPSIQHRVSSIEGSISQQIMESIHASLRQDNTSVTIRLKPPELGEVFVRFQGQEDEVVGLLEVSRAQTKYEIEQALPQIIRALTDCGVQIRRLDVLLTNQPEHEAGKDQSPADGGFLPSADRGADSFERGGYGSSSTSSREAAMDTYGYENIRGQPAESGFVTDDSINVLI